jgi:hypothetical protein
MNTETNPSSDLRFTGYQAATTHGAISDLINPYWRVTGENRTKSWLSLQAFPATAGGLRYPHGVSATGGNMGMGQN